MTVEQLIARLQGLPANLPVVMTGGDSDFCYVAEAYEDVMCENSRWGLGLCDEWDAGSFKVVRLFGAEAVGETKAT